MDKIENKLLYQREKEFIQKIRNVPENKEKLKRLYKQKIYCEVCDTFITKYNFKKHKTTFKHVSKEDELNKK